MSLAVRDVLKGAVGGLRVCAPGKPTQRIAIKQAKDAVFSAADQEVRRMRALIWDDHYTPGAQVIIAYQEFQLVARRKKVLRARREDEGFGKPHNAVAHVMSTEVGVDDTVAYR